MQGNLALCNIVKSPYLEEISGLSNHLKGYLELTGYTPITKAECAFTLDEEFFMM